MDDYKCLWQGEYQWVFLEFPQSVKVSELKVQFQGGFSAKTCRLEGKTQRLHFPTVTIILMWSSTSFNILVLPIANKILSVFYVCPFRRLPKRWGLYGDQPFISRRRQLSSDILQCYCSKWLITGSIVLHRWDHPCEVFIYFNAKCGRKN